MVPQSQKWAFFDEKADNKEPQMSGKILNFDFYSFLAVRYNLMLPWNCILLTPILSYLSNNQIFTRSKFSLKRLNFKWKLFIICPFWLQIYQKVRFFCYQTSNWTIYNSFNSRKYKMKLQIFHFFHKNVGIIRHCVEGLTSLMKWSIFYCFFKCSATLTCNIF